MSAFERPGETPQETGRRFEKIWAKFFGVEPKRGSGNQWYTKLDVGTSAITFSLKHSSSSILRFGKQTLSSLMREAQDGADSDAIPGIALSENGTVYVVFRGEDFLRMAQTGDIHYITPSKGDQKRSRAKVPSLLRDE